MVPSAFSLLLKHLKLLNFIKIVDYEYVEGSAKFVSSTSKLRARLCKCHLMFSILYVLNMAWGFVCPSTLTTKLESKIFGGAIFMITVLCSLFQWDQFLNSHGYVQVLNTLDRAEFYFSKGKVKNQFTQDIRMLIFCILKSVREEK